MKLLLCSDGDDVAMWAYNMLTSLGCADLELVTTGELANAKQWSHRINIDGPTVDIELQDGRKINASQVDGVINRLNWPSGALFGQATREDQEYAWQESAAFYLSWLNSFPGKVFNRATPQGLCGSWRSRSQWSILAGRAGFNVVTCTEEDAVWNPKPQTSKPLRSVVIFDGKPFGSFDASSLETACRRLSEYSRTGLLGIDLCQAEDGSWLFHGATPMPDLSAGGVPLLMEVMKAWYGEARQ